MNPPVRPESPHVYGLNLDEHTRCLHYRGPTDVIAIKMRCCGLFYACKDCHEALAGHALERWPQSEWHEPAILCGVCRSTLSISAYLNCNSVCPDCGAPFNPGCSNHYRYYFAAAAAG